MKQRTFGFALVGAVVLAIVAACGDGAAAPAPVTTAPTPTATGTGHMQVYGFPDVADGRGWDFEIPVPEWPVQHAGDHATYTDPTGKFVLETDRVPITQEDALGGLKAIAKTNKYPGYHETRLAEHDPVAGSEAAEWDFTYVRDGVTRQASVVGVGVGDVLITIRYEAPQPDFPANQSVLAAALEVSAPG